MMKQWKNTGFKALMAAGMLIAALPLTAQAFVHKDDGLHTKEYGTLYPVREGLAAFSNVNGKYGFMNDQGEVVLQPQWDLVSDFYEEGVAVVFSGEITVNGDPGKGICQLIDRNGTALTPEYAWISEVCNGYAAFMDENEAYGIIDSKGNIVANPEWDWATVFADDIFQVQSGEKYAYMNQQGEMISDFNEAYNGIYSEGRAGYQNDDGLCGFLDENQEIVIDCTWAAVYPFQEGIAMVKSTDGSYGFIDKNGEIVSEPGWANADYFSDGYAWVTAWSGEDHLIDRSGQILHTPSDLCFNGRASESMIAAYPADDDMMGFYDIEKEIFYPLNADTIRRFQGGLGYFAINEKFGAIDHDGTIVIPAEWDTLYPFREDSQITAAQKDGNWYLIDRSGQVLQQIDLGSEAFVAGTTMDDSYLRLRQTTIDNVVGTWKVAYTENADGTVSEKDNLVEVEIRDDGTLRWRPIGWDFSVFGTWTIIQVAEGSTRPSRDDFQIAYELVVEGNRMLSFFIDRGNNNFNQLKIKMMDGNWGYFIRKESPVERGYDNYCDALDAWLAAPDDTEAETLTPLPATIEQFDQNLMSVLEKGQENIEFYPYESPEGGGYYYHISCEGRDAGVMFAELETGGYATFVYTDDDTPDRTVLLTTTAYAICILDPERNPAEVKAKIAEELSAGNSEMYFGDLYLIVDLDENVAGIVY